MIDLHTHSTASDGNFSPTELVQYAASKKIQVLALTDHDTTSGLKEACDAARNTGITLIPGIEITVEWPTGEFHLLGLGIKSASEKMNEVCQFLKQERIDRNMQMAEKLREQGVQITYEEVSEHFNTTNVGRPHFAQMLVEKGIVKQRQTAFDKYFAKGRPCYVDRHSVNLEDAIEAIKTSGGIPVQAHPMSMYVSWGKMEETMCGIISRGVMGIEAWHPGVRVSEAERLEKMAAELGVICTAGSDFHGEKVRADRHIGYTAGKQKIQDRFWHDHLKPALEKIHGTTELSFE